jgi:hypothetical protein
MERQEVIMDGVSNVSQPASSNGAQAAPPQVNNSGQLNGLQVRQAEGPAESPLNKNKPLIPGKDVPAVGIPAANPNVDNAAARAQQPAAAPTNLQVVGSATFRQQVARDLAAFAPGTTVDTQGFVRAAAKEQAGHTQGYQLINNLLNNPNRVTIQFTANDAFTQSGAGSQGTPTRPGRGSTASVSYDPSLNINLPTLQRNGTIRDERVASSVVLAHELIHATHAQRGTIDRSLVNHDFTDGTTRYRENWRFEEFRTTGFAGARQGTEPTENSIRGELGFNPRAAYLDRSSWTRR